ncbi:MAG TPA: hypothetical protein VG389_01585, partial [Myxococcota bacterium]|nr:hypothetical protein [Myxococcota bacterium]
MGFPRGRTASLLAALAAASCGGAVAASGGAPRAPRQAIPADGPTVVSRELRAVRGAEADTTDPFVAVAAAPAARAAPDDDARDPGARAGAPDRGGDDGDGAGDGDGDG